MPDAKDMDLVREYADGNSEPAFAELVHRHINLVYSVGLRFTGNAADAQDVTQAVFIILAQKAAGLRQGTILTGWLYETTRFTAMNLLRTRARQHVREQEAYMQSTLNDANPDPVWQQLAPLLEEAMTRLNEKERTLLALRFFENKSGAETAAMLGMQEWAARKRVERAVEKLRSFFTKRGTSSTTAIITGAISANSVHAAPVALAKSITAVAMTKGATAGGSTLILVKGALKLMAWTKAKTAIIASAGILVAAGTATMTMEAWQINEHTSNGDILERFPPQVNIVNTKFPGAGYEHMGKVTVVDYGGKIGSKMLGINRSVEQMMTMAYYGHGPLWTILPDKMPDGKYDFIANLSAGSKEGLQLAIKNKFGLVAKHETREMDVMLVQLKNPGAPGLKPIHDNIVGGGPLTHGLGYLHVTEEGFLLARDLEEAYFRIPVIDQTGLKERFRFDLTWPNPDRTHQNLEGLKRAMLDQYGLELVSSRKPVDMLVIEKVK